jgi:hypothetical protein
MTDHATRVRDCASALKTAIQEATAEGYRVAWAGRLAELDTIAVSETGKVKPVETPKVATFGSPKKSKD